MTVSDTRDLTGSTGSTSSPVSAEKYGCFLIELNALRVAECVVLSPLFESGKSSPLPEEVFCKPAQGLSVTVAMAVRENL